MNRMLFIILFFLSFISSAISQSKTNVCDLAIYEITDSSFCYIIDTLIATERELGIDVTDDCSLMVLSVLNDSSLFLIRRNLMVSDTVWTTMESAGLSAYAYCGLHQIDLPICKNIENMMRPSGRFLQLPCISASEISYEDIYPEEGDASPPHVTLLVKSDKDHGCKIISMDFYGMEAFNPKTKRVMVTGDQ